MSIKSASNEKEYINNYKCLAPILSMVLRSFYLYKLKSDTESPFRSFLDKFSSTKITQNIIDIMISEDEERKFLLVIQKQEGNFLYGLFYKLSEDIEMNILDEGAGKITITKLEENHALAEKSRLIIDLKTNLIFGEYNDAGVRFFQTPFGEYLKKSLNRQDIEIEVVYNKENYENIGNKSIKYFKIKVTKPKIGLMEEIFDLSGLDVFDEADDSSSLTIELKIKAGRRKSFGRTFVNKVLSKFNSITNKEGIKKFEVGQTNIDTPLELVKDKILKKKVETDGKTDENVFTELVEMYESLGIEEYLDLEDEEEDE